MTLFLQELSQPDHERPENERLCHIMSTGAILLADVSYVHYYFFFYFFHLLNNRSLLNSNSIRVKHNEKKKNQAR